MHSRKFSVSLLVSRATPVLAMAALASVVGCGGVIEFQGKTPIAVVGNPPAPPPKVEPKKEARVEVKADKIEIKEKIQFELNSSVIKPESFSLMDEISQVIVDHPELQEIAIEGHASSEGNANVNTRLSDDRAKSVMAYIVKKNVDAKRLTAKGYGSSKPIADNATEEGRIANRRVEFKIVKIDASKAKAPAAQPAASK